MTRMVDIVEDKALWEANHPGETAPEGQIAEVDFAPTDGRLSGQKWHECDLCGHVDRESAMTAKGGKWYCSKYGCATEVTE